MTAAAFDIIITPLSQGKHVVRPISTKGLNWIRRNCASKPMDLTEIYIDSEHAAEYVKLIEADGLSVKDKDKI